MRPAFAKRHLDTWFLLGMTGALLAAFAIVQPSWFTRNLVQEVIAQNTPLALVAMAMTFAIISRLIDLSPGSMVSLIGVVIGLVAGFYRGSIDTVLSRLTDVVLAFPILLLGLGVAAACSGAEGCVGGLIQPGLSVVIAIIVLANTPYVARIIRGQVLSLREKEFVEASKSLGASNARIMFRDILPNLVAPIIVYATLFIPANILLEAALSFLGVGVQPPRASWGDMLSDAVSIFDVAWWFMFFPGMALLLTVLAFNLVGDGLQDALNPKGTKST